MINFDAVEFSEGRSEEVISFFWRSVYVGLDAGIPSLENLRWYTAFIPAEMPHLYQLQLKPWIWAKSQF